MHKMSMHNMRLFISDYLDPMLFDISLQILDVGSQDINGGYRNLFNIFSSWKYTGLDIVKGPNVDLVEKDPYHWFNLFDESYDVVISGQTLEHVEYPWLTIQEMARVLKSGGLMCIIVPSSGPCHRFPIDCYRYFPDGMIALAKWAKLKVIQCYNCWDVPALGGEMNVWKDTVLIARKP